LSIQRSIVFTVLAQVPTLLLYFLSSVLMTNVLGDEGRGYFALLQNITVFITLIFAFNLNLGLMYRVARSGGDQRVPVGMAVSVFAVNVLAVPMVLGVLAWDPRLRDIFFPGPLASPWFVGYVLVSVLLNQTITFVAAMVQGLKLFVILNRMSILAAAISCTGFGVVWLFRERIAPEHLLPCALAITLVGVAVQALCWAVIYTRRIGLPLKPCLDWPTIKPFMAFVLTGYFILLINLINYRFDIWVVAKYAGADNLGLYAAAVGVGQMFFNIPEPLSRAVQPYLYATDDEAMLHRFKAVARLNFTLVLILCLFTGLIAAWLVPWLYGEKFAGSVTALRWLLPGIVFLCAYKLLAVVITQRGLLRFNLYGAIIGACTTVVLDLVLIPRTGIQGAALASSIAYLTILAVTCVVLRFRLGIPVADLFLMRPTDVSLLRSQFLKLTAPDRK
jgi:O-antigen/teichoic acid export membrane protein